MKFDRNRSQGPAYFVTVREGPQNLAEIKFQMQAHILQKKQFLHTCMRIVEKKSTVLTLYANKNTNVIM